MITEGWTTVAVLEQRGKKTVARMSTKGHAEVLAAKHLNPKQHARLTVARVRRGRVGGLQYSLAKPCAHCTKHLRQLGRFVHERFGAKLAVRYTTNASTLTPWCPADRLTPGQLSSGHRLRLRKQRKRL